MTEQNGTEFKVVKGVLENIETANKKDGSQYYRLVIDGVKYSCFDAEIIVPVKDFFPKRSMVECVYVEKDKYRNAKSVKIIGESSVVSQQAANQQQRVETEEETVGLDNMTLVDIAHFVNETRKKLGVNGKVFATQVIPGKLGDGKACCLIHILKKKDFDWRKAV